MWLTCQMGIKVPPSIRKDDGDEVRLVTGKKDSAYFMIQLMSMRHPMLILLMRVVLHVDFFNTLKMTKLEIEVMQYIYDMREQFMKAEGVAKVGSQVFLIRIIFLEGVIQIQSSDI
jgi:hypothetical protein